MRLMTGDAASCRAVFTVKSGGIARQLLVAARTKRGRLAFEEETFFAIMRIMTLDTAGGTRESPVNMGL